MGVRGRGAESRQRPARKVARLILLLSLQLALVATGCSTGATEDASAEDPQRVVIALDSFANENSLPWAMPVADGQLWSHVYDGLLSRNLETFELEPGLAVEWDHSEDFRTWTFRLREGVEFHGGYGEMTAEDVKFTFEQFQSDSATAPATALFRQIESIETPDDYTVVLNMASPNWRIPDAVTQWSSGGLPVTSKEYFEEVGEEAAIRAPIGTGPFELVDSVQGQEYTFKAVADHWRHTPEVQELVLRRIPDAATAISALRSGEIDAAPVSGDNITTVENATGLRVVSNEQGSANWVVLPGFELPDAPDYCPECPWVGQPDDRESQEDAKRVRYALEHAIDKEAIVDSVFHGYGNVEPMNYLALPTTPEFDETVTPLEYDPELARELLAEAGYPDGFEINLALTATSIDGPRLAQAVAQYWEQIGLTVNQRNVEFGAFLAGSRARDNDVSAYTYSTATAIPNTVVNLESGSTSSAPFNLLINSSDTDQRIAELASILDTETRVEETRQFLTELHEQRYAIMIGYRQPTFAVSDAITDWAMYPHVRFPHNYEYLSIGGR